MQFETENYSKLQVSLKCTNTEKEVWWEHFT